MSRFITLPVELKWTIINHVESHDLLVLRKSCRTLQELCYERFVVDYIRRRRHVMTFASLKALVDISAHPKYGPFVETVILNATWPEGSSYTDVYTTGIHNLLLDAFKNFRMYRQKMVVGVNDLATKSHGLGELLRCPDARLYAQKRHIAYDLLKDTCIKTGLDIGGLEVDIAEQSQASGERDFDVGLFANAVSRRLPRTFNHQDMLLRMKVAFEHIRDFSLNWFPDNKTLSIDGLTHWDDVFYWNNPICWLLREFNWAADLGITSLELTDCSVHNDGHLHEFENFLQACLQNLQRVNIERVVLKNFGSWARVLKNLSEAPSLESFDLISLSRTIHTQVNGQDETAIFLQVTRWSGAGEDVRAQLESLAAAIRLDETDWAAMAESDPRKWGYFDGGHSRPENTTSFEEQTPAEPTQICHHSYTSTASQTPASWSQQSNEDQSIAEERTKSLDLTTTQGVKEVQVHSSETTSSSTDASPTKPDTKVVEAGSIQIASSQESVMLDSNASKSDLPVWSSVQNSPASIGIPISISELNMTLGALSIDTIASSGKEDKLYCSGTTNGSTAYDYKSSLLAGLSSRPSTHLYKPANSFIRQMEEAIDKHALSPSSRDRMKAPWKSSGRSIQQIVQSTSSELVPKSPRPRNSNFDKTTQTYKYTAKAESFLLPQFLPRIDSELESGGEGDHITNWSKDLCHKFQSVNFLGSTRVEETEEDWTRDLGWDLRRIFDMSE